VNPHLPAQWDHAEIEHLPLPGGVTSIHFHRVGERLEVYLSPKENDGWHLKSDLSGATAGVMENGPAAKKLKESPLQGIRIPLPQLEVDESGGADAELVTNSSALMNNPPLPGARTSRFRIIRSENGDHKLVLTAEGLAGSEGLLALIRHGRFIPKVETDPGATANANISFRGCDADPYACTELPLILSFPPGDGWKVITATLTW
jgi:hypothetical protein